MIIKKCIYNSTFLFRKVFVQKTCHSSRWQFYKSFLSFFDSLFILLYKILKERLVVNDCVFHRSCNFQFVILHFPGNGTWCQQHISNTLPFFLSFSMNRFFFLILMTVKANYKMFWPVMSCIKRRHALSYIHTLWLWCLWLMCLDSLVEVFYKLLERKIFFIIHHSFKYSAILGTCLYQMLNKFKKNSFM